MLAASMTSDDPVKEWILSEGGASEIKRVSSVGGGCINVATKYETDCGSFFVKTNRLIETLILLNQAAFFCFKENYICFVLNMKAVWAANVPVRSKRTTGNA